MPKDTFYNLSAAKRKAIISAATEEFAKTNYHMASINQICKKANIAKGSFYQYFNDKLDLYVYIMKQAIEEKVSFFTSSLENFEHLTLLEQLHLLYAKGIEFANENRLYAELGEQFAKEDDEIVKSVVVEHGEGQAEDIFTQLIESAKVKGEINEAVDTLALSMLLQSLNNSVNEYMLNKYGNVDYEMNKEEVNAFIDSLLNIIFQGIQKENY